MPKIVVMLPSNRDLSGLLHLEDDRKHVLAGPFPVAGRADDENAARHGNPLRQSILPYGDTPTGTYRVSRLLQTGDGTPYDSRRYGEHGAILMEPVAGDAAIADANGRFRLLIHGGDTDSHNRLLATNGALRLSNSDMKLLVDTVRGLQNVTCQCVETLPFSESLPISVTSMVHEPDPPLLHPADTTQLLSQVAPKQSRRDFMYGVGISALAVTAPVFIWNVASESAQAQGRGGGTYCPGGLALSLSPGAITGEESSLATIQNFNTYKVNVTLTSDPPNALTFHTNPITIPAATTHRGNCTAGVNSSTITANSVNSANPTVTVTASDSEGDRATALLVLRTPACDFDGDGNNDLLFQNTQTGLITAWFMDGLKVRGASTIDTLPDAGWNVVGTADFTGDGQPDLVLQNATSGKVEIWYLNGTKVRSKNPVSAQPVAGYKMVATGDFNGDGKIDLVFQNQNTGLISIWFMDGPAVIGGQALPLPYHPAAGWKVVGAGDFNGDLQADLLFQNATTGQLVVWFMNGPNVVGGVTMSVAPQAGWQAKGVADYNNDGSADIVFQNSTTHQVVIWFMNGVGFEGGNPLSVQPQSPNVLVGPH